MDSAPTIDIPLPSEHPGREDPSPASRDPLNALICAILNPYCTIEEIAENRKITVMRLGEILSAEPASSTIESLRKVFALRAELLALHARASAVGTLTRIANSGKDDEVARRAATSLLRMFRPDGTPAPLPPERHRDRTPSPASPVTDGGGGGGHVHHSDLGPVRAPDRGSERSGSSSPSSPTSATSSHAHTPAMSESEIAGSSHRVRSSLDDPTSPKRERGPSHPNAPSRASDPLSPVDAAPTPSAAPAERGGPEERQPLRSATTDPSLAYPRAIALSRATHHHRSGVHVTPRLQHAHDPP